MNMAGDANLALIAKGLFQVRVDWVDVPTDRLRALKPDQARAIGEAIKADRQYDAIAVTQLPGKDRFLLVDGLHRLEGCRMAGIEMIEARLVSANRESRRRQELMSAWARADHDAIDKAAQVASAVDFAKAGAAEPEDGEQACVMITQAVRWDLGVAKDLGISRETVMLYLRLHRSYDDAEKKVLRDKGLAGQLMPLLRLAALPDDSFAVAWTYIQQTKEPTIAEALAAATPSLPVEPSWEKKREKVLAQARTWQPHQLTDLIDKLYELRRQMTGGEIK